jgi:hypothetical protein
LIVTTDAAPTTPLGAADLVRIAELAHGVDVLGQLKLFLAAEDPGAAAEALTSWPIGRCDAAIWALRCRTFGASAPCQTICAACGAELELDLPSDIVASAPAALAVPALEVNGYVVEARLPTLSDVAEACRASREPSVARRALVERCIVSVTLHGVIRAAHELADAVVERLAEHLEALDPAASVRLACDCADCGARCELFLDPTSFFGRELGAEAARLLEQVDRLARAYGWSEAAILGLPRSRRQRYLALIGAR